MNPTEIIAASPARVTKTTSFSLAEWEQIEKIQRKLNVRYFTDINRRAYAALAREMGLDAEPFERKSA